MKLTRELQGQYAIVTTEPPIYNRAKEVFKIPNFEEGVVFTYAPNIHVFNGKLDADLLEHELIHIKQQMAYPGGVVAWWERYFLDPVWRLEQELEAYRHQYKYVVDHCPKHSHFHMLRFFAKCLCKIYALDGMSEVKAMNLIK